MAKLCIVGMSCRLGADGDNIEKLWESLVAGRCGSEPIENSKRWNHDAFFAPRAQAKKGHYYARNATFLKEIPGIDIGYFGISPKEATQMDPQQRLMLELATEAFEDAGAYGWDDHPTLRCVHWANEQRPRCVARTRLDGPAHGSGSATSITANRISYFWTFAALLL